PGLTPRRLSGTIQSISERTVDYRTKFRAPSSAKCARPFAQANSRKPMRCKPIQSPIVAGHLAGRTDMTAHQGRVIDRRTLIRHSGAALAAGAIGAPAIAQAKTIRLGYVSLQTGPLAAFAEADNFIIANFKDATKAGLRIGNATYPVDVVVKDSQSNPNRAAEVAKELIVRDKIDLMLVASTPETTNPVSTQCEIEEVPCVSTVAPLQPSFIGRQANPAGGPAAWKPFNHTYHFFLGLVDVIAVFTNMWGQLQTNKSVGGLFPNDGDGNAWGDKQVGFPPVLDQKGFKLT